MRKGDNSLSKLQDLQSQFQSFRCTLYYNPETRSSFIRAKLPSKLQEILGVMHMKFFVFDDTVLITGYAIEMSRNFITSNLEPTSEILILLIEWIDI